jgi:hypothetical protein
MGWAQTTGAIRVLSDGTPWRPLVHIEDIARAALAAVTAPRESVHNQPFNIGGSDANYRVRDIALAVQRAVPEARVEITGGDLRSYRVDFTKALAGLPGFAPQWTLERGVEELARWFHDEGVCDGDFQSRVYIRLKRLQHLSWCAGAHRSCLPAKRAVETGSLPAAGACLFLAPLGSDESLQHRIDPGLITGALGLEPT